MNAISRRVIGKARASWVVSGSSVIANSIPTGHDGQPAKKERGGRAFLSGLACGLLLLLFLMSGLGIARPSYAQMRVESAQLEAVPGDPYSHFEFTFENDDLGLESNLDDFAALPRIRISGFLHTGGAETLEITEEFWAEFEEVVDVVGMDWLESQQDQIADDDDFGGVPGSGPGGSGDDFGIGPNAQQVSLAISSFINGAGTVFEEHHALIASLQGALQKNEVQGFAANRPGLTGCDNSYAAFHYALFAAKLEHYFALLPTIMGSSTTCGLIPEPTATLRCAAQLGLWLFGSTWFVVATEHGREAKAHLDHVVKASVHDGVGVQINASQTLAPSIARHSKLSEVNAWETYQAIGVLTAQVAAATAFGGPGVYIAGGLELATIGLALEFFSRYHTCQIRVVAPRFETSSVRMRTYLRTPDGWEHWVPKGLSENITAMSREVALRHVQEIDAEKFFEENRDNFPTFNPTTQSQLLELRICEGVVVPPDPGSLPWPFHQRANTPYLLETSGFTTEQFPFFGSWPKFINRKETILPMPFAGSTMHRICEDGYQGEIIDNDNDGVPENHVSDRCGLLPGLGPDPAGEVEEDVYLHPAFGAIAGETEWHESGLDMSCTGISLDLASKQGLTGKSVKSEWVLDLASYWTNAADGLASNSPQHPQDSTQVRFRIVDDDWGKPRPRGCFSWSARSSRWVCDGQGSGCLCGGSSGGAPGL